MRDIPAPFASALASGVTTLCHCWRLLPRAGAPLGFTDHDRDLVFDGTTFAAARGLEASAFESNLGFAVGGGEVAGALSSAALEERDLASGAWDGATLEIWRVDWTNPAARLLLDIAVIGEARRTEFAFTAELRSIAHELDQPQGRLYQKGCDADLGDARCGVDLSSAAYRVATTVSATDGRLTLAAPAAGFASGFFDGGALVFASGANLGARVAVRDHRADGALARISLWTPLARPIAAGDAITLTAGCDKSFATCGAKFDNRPNFRGFPHMPGNDVVMSVADASDPAMDGGSLLR